MTLYNTKLTMAVLWVVVAIGVAAVSGPASPGGWALLTALGLLPPLALLWLWREPEQTMAESIHEGRR